MRMRASRRYIAILTSALCIMAPIKVAVSNILPDADGQDDSAVIVEHIRESLNSSGLVSIEQHTGRLLYNPEVAKLNAMQLKQKMIIPAMVINQQIGIKLVAEMPLSCFMLSAQELASENYKGFRQYETLRYIRDIKGMQVTRALICEPVGKSAGKSWKGYLALEQDDEPFVFEAHTSASGEKFYYFVNNDGYFEMYL
jgi:hypothetical protein